MADIDPGRAPGATGILYSRRSEITWIGPASELDPPADAVQIDGSNHWLMPGLADMHAHMDASDVPLFLANGITTVREMNGSEAQLALRDSIDQGLRLGPRLLVASSLLAGQKQRWRHELIDDSQAAYAIAHEAQQAGYDYLKVYDGLSETAYLALAEAGIPIAEVLRAATTGAARFTGDEAMRGVVKVGALADLVLLEQDPREDLAALHNPVGVMTRGRWLDRTTLDRMLANIDGSQIGDAGSRTATLVERAQDDSSATVIGREPLE